MISYLGVAEKQKGPGPGDLLCEGGREEEIKQVFPFVLIRLLDKIGVLGPGRY